MRKISEQERETIWKRQGRFIHEGIPNSASVIREDLEKLQNDGYRIWWYRFPDYAKMKFYVSKDDECYVVFE